MAISPGDTVVCRIRNGIIIDTRDEEWENEAIFDIICIYGDGYLIYVPAGICLKDQITLTKENFIKFNADKKFIGSEIYYITDYRIVKVHSKIDGICCNKCGEFYRYAASNQDDGTFTCWSCRNYKFYK
jgi:hypothetical protein